MPTITLPDNRQLSFENAVTVEAVVADIGAGLAKAALAAKVNDVLVDLSHVIDKDATLKVISKDNLEALSISVPKMHIFRRVIAENLFITMEKRIAALQSQSAAARYENMLRDNPDILLSVPLQYTASFLGITPQHLSRLRKELLK